MSEVNVTSTLGLKKKSSGKKVSVLLEHFDLYYSAKQKRQGLSMTSYLFPAMVIKLTVFSGLD